MEESNFQMMQVPSGVSDVDAKIKRENISVWTLRLRFWIYNEKIGLITLV